MGTAFPFPPRPPRIGHGQRDRRRSRQHAQGPGRLHAVGCPQCPGSASRLARLNTTVGMSQTTSPAAFILASIDAARSQMALRGRAVARQCARSGLPGPRAAARHSGANRRRWRDAGREPLRPDQVRARCRRHGHHRFRGRSTRYAHRFSHQSGGKRPRLSRLLRNGWRHASFDRPAGHRIRDA